MDGVLVVVIDPRSLAQLAVAGVLPMVSYPFAMPMEVWRRLTDNRSDPVAFALHAWFEANRTRVRLLDPSSRQGRVDLGGEVALAVLTEDRRIAQTINQQGRAAVLAISSDDLFRALEAGSLIHSAESVAAAAAEQLADRGGSSGDDYEAQARLSHQLFEDLKRGLLTLA
jgi:hypothetical protein